ncbi:MAG: hypothetical protein C5S44_07290 [Candidatus Methanocomedens sp.]|nr:MAG: hypothetical protein C5S44_07290 [ANME-2 cluster archaeon]
MNKANYGKCRDLSVIWEFSKMLIKVILELVFLDINHINKAYFQNLLENLKQKYV